MAAEAEPSSSMPGTRRRQLRSRNGRADTPSLENGGRHSFSGEWRQTQYSGRRANGRRLETTRPPLLAAAFGCSRSCRVNARAVHACSIECLYAATFLFSSAHRQPASLLGMPHSLMMMEFICKILAVVTPPPSLTVALSSCVKKFRCGPGLLGSL